MMGLEQIIAIIIAILLVIAFVSWLIWSSRTEDYEYPTDWEKSRVMGKQSHFAKKLENGEFDFEWFNMVDTVENIIEHEKEIINNGYHRVSEIVYNLLHIYNSFGMINDTVASCCIKTNGNLSLTYLDLNNIESAQHSAIAVELVDDKIYSVKTIGQNEYIITEEMYNLWLNKEVKNESISLSEV
jgi:hypothetical protein